MFNIITVINKTLTIGGIMGITERRQFEKEIIRKKIIDATNDILVEEGYENLSIRKIASRIEYSPGIIYHYFKDKAEIVSFVVAEGYGNILKIISEIPIDTENPDKTIVNGMRSYIELMLENPQQFRVVLMNDIETIQEKVNMLQEGISKERKSIQGLCKLVELAIRKNIFRKMDIELTAQIIWTSTHGLVSRLILEKNITKQQKERLINHHFEILINGLLK
ncbi:TetR/AcrR family transcriptional regulator [Clostridium sp. CF011]|nr:TetR/AcrR family transcriptional regulator [Clostridium sp. CF011]